MNSIVKVAVLFFLLQFAVSFGQDEDLAKMDDQCAIASARVINEVQAALVPAAVTNVSVELIFFQVGNINAARNTYDATLILGLSWFDKRLIFNDTNCTKGVIVDKISSVWFPSFIISNAATAIDFGTLKERPAIVTANGEVVWRIGLTLSLICRYNTQQFPFDEQTCFVGVHSPIYFTSRFLHGLKTKTWCLGDPFAMSGVDFIPEEGGTIQFWKSSVVDMPLWQIVGSCHHVSPEDLVSNMFFYFTMQRKPLIYVTSLFIPMIVVSVVQSVSFTDDLTGEKVSIPITALLAYFFLSAIVVEEIPESSENMPLVLYLLTFLFIDGAAATLASILICNYGETAPDPASPETRATVRRLNKAALGVYAVVTTGAYVAYFLCATTFYHKISQSEVSTCQPGPLVITADYAADVFKVMS